MTNYVVVIPRENENPNPNLRVQVAKIVKIPKGRQTIFVRWWQSQAETLRRAEWRFYSMHNHQSATEISVDRVLVTFDDVTTSGLIPARFRSAIEYKLEKRDEGVKEWNWVVDQRALNRDISMEADSANIEEYTECLPRSSARSQRLTLYPDSKEIEPVSDDEDSGGDTNGDNCSGIGSGSDDEWKPNNNGDVVYYEDAYVQSTRDLPRTRSGAANASSSSAQ